MSSLSQIIAILFIRVAGCDRWRDSCGTDIFDVGLLEGVNDVDVRH